MATAQVTLTLPSGYDIVTLAPGFDPFIFQEWSSDPAVGDHIVFATANNTSIDSNGDMQTESDGEVEVFHVSQTGMWTYAPVNYAGLSEGGGGTGGSGEDSATATVTLTLPSGYEMVTLGSGFDPYIFQEWSEDPLEGDHIVFSTADGTSIDSNGDMQTESEGNVDVFHVSQTGVWTYAPINYADLASAPGEVPSEAPTVGEVVVTETTATIPVTYEADDADSLEYSWSDGPWTTFVSPLELSDLSAGTVYTLSVRARNAKGPGPEFNLTVTTVSDVRPATATVTLTLPAGYKLVTLASGFDPYIFQEWSAIPLAGEHIVFATANGTDIDANGDMRTESEEIVEVFHISRTGVWTYAPIDYAGLTVANPAPVGIPEFGTVELTATTATVNVTYAVDDADSLEYSLDGEPWVTFISPIELTELEQGSAHTLEVRARNVGGTGPQATTTFTTLDIPQGETTFGSPTVSEQSAFVPFSYSLNDHTGYEYNFEGNGWVSISNSPVSLSSLTPGTQYSVAVRPINSVGPGAEAVLSFTTAQPSVGPTVTGCSVPSNGNYPGGTTLTFTVSFDKPVEVFGSPRLTLLIGTNVRHAHYVAGSGGDTLSFTYTVLTGDYAPEGLEVVALQRNGGQINDLPGDPADLSLRGVPSTDGVIVDAIPPKLTINPLSTTDTTPVLSGNCDDAISLTLRVRGVVYTPTPVDGKWSQQLSSLPPGPHQVILDGHDAAGNPANQETGTVIIEHPTTEGSSGTFDFNLQVDEIIEEAYERIGMEVSSGYDARTARRSLNLLLTEWANHEITLWTTQRRVFSTEVGQARYELSKSDVDIMEVAIRMANGNDYVISRTSRSESIYVPDKTQQGRPMQYYFDRQLTPTIELWPVPDKAMSLVVDVFTFTQDVTASGQDMAMPRRFLPALIAGLAYHLALKKQPGRAAETKALYDQALALAMNADEEVKSFTVRPRRRRR